MGRQHPPRRLALAARYGVTVEPHSPGHVVHGPGQVVGHWPALRRPYGSLVLAGEHTATFTGYVEGQSRAASGQRRQC
jgi:monoamine oxidase